MKDSNKYALCFTTQNWFILHSKDIASGSAVNEIDKKAINDCHIYMIHTRPLVSFVENSVSYDRRKEYLSGKVRATLLNGECIESNFSLKFKLKDNAISVKSLPPYREITTHDSKGDVVRVLPAHLLCGTMSNNHLVDALLNLKVEYIGQAFGNGNKNSLDRLKNHSTFQKILSEIPYHNPNLEIFVSIMNFQEPILYNIPEIDDCDDKNEIEKLWKIIDNPPFKKEQINLIEAGLIRYFQPHFNIKLKMRFPSAKQQMLSKLTKLGITGLIIELPKSEMGFKIYSDTVLAQYSHFAMYDLTTNKTGFFNHPIKFCNPDDLIRMTKD